MSNTLSVFDPLFYALEGLIALQKALGMAGRAHRGYDKNPQEKGSIISIRVPSVFTAQDAPAVNPNDIHASEVQVTLNKWKEVKIGLTDKELSFTKEDVIREHINPMAYAIADAIDQELTALYKDIPWYKDTSGTMVVGDITSLRQILFDNAVPMNDLHCMVNGQVENELLALAAFTQWSGAGQAAVDSQLRGTLGTRFGIEFFANQNVKSHTGGVCADAAGAIDNGAGYAAGVKTVHVDGLTENGTAKIGDILKITGHTQQYVLTADATFTGASGDADVSFEPGLEAAVVDDQVATFVVGNKTESLAFHRSAFALAMAPLSEFGNGLGAQIATVTDPVTGLALRARRWYEGSNSKCFVGLDALYGVKTLNRNMACRFRD